MSASQSVSAVVEMCLESAEDDLGLKTHGNGQRKGGTEEERL